jgi:TRAP-type mannitol/chloroaromatic compound transport system permease large subunit
MNLTSPFSLSLVAITALAFLGLPIGHSMIAGSILYLLLAGQDMGTAAEQLLNGMYSNYVILSVPLFILAAEFMNIGSMTDRLMSFCNALVGRFRGPQSPLSSGRLSRHQFQWCSMPWSRMRPSGSCSSAESFLDCSWR